VAGADELRRALVEAGLLEAAHLGEEAPIQLHLPAGPEGPQPSDRLAAAAGRLDPPPAERLGSFSVATVRVREDRALEALLRLEDRAPAGAVAPGSDLRYWAALVRFVVELLADQRFIPSLIQTRSGGMKAAWRPWLHDEDASARLHALVEAMPPLVRAVGDGYIKQPWRIVHEAAGCLTDATIRQALIEENYEEALVGRDTAGDQHVAWFSGLLGGGDDVPQTDVADGLLRRVQGWVGQLEETGRPRTVRLAFCLREPEGEIARDPEAAGWRLGLGMAPDDEPELFIDAARVWAASPAARQIDGHPIERPQESLLTELGRACRIYPRLEEALGEQHPTGLDLTTADAVQFLRDFRPVLEESGFAVAVPEWWDRPARRLGVRLVIDAPAQQAGGESAGSSAGPGPLGLQSLVGYRWQVAVGDQPLSAEDLRRLRGLDVPLVRLGDRWVEVSNKDLDTVEAFMKADPGGQMTLLEAIRTVQGEARATRGSQMPTVLGLDASGWVGDVLEADGSERLPALAQPTGFIGTLRPYQVIGLRWLVFLERHGLGACLADDMGLGKTIQLIALLQAEREQEADAVPPTLLVVPTSLITNWTRELSRFAPELRWHVHHGPQRPMEDKFLELAAAGDVVITTYALVPRDIETLGALLWRRIALDEAQYIKNPPTKQASAIKRLRAQRRVALTGTPIENRLSELWSIMDFCNPGYLGSAEEFRRRSAVPIERHRDRERAKVLRRLVQPFVLRRLKTDPTVIEDLPPCVETREYAMLTPEQAALYQAIVDRLLAEIDNAEGITRRGRVLAALMRLKQVCNHPAQLPDEIAGPRRRLEGAVSRRSGKCARLLQMLEEIVAAGDKALVFTQFRKMGHLLSAMVSHELDTEALFMHGGTPRPRRQAMIDEFQAGPGTAPVFILSLKTGGLGLNLTGANHVFHFDRWWNPAVENQATDRAHRIGQTRTVHVHKFVCTGTLEERIDQMIEHKMQLADNIISTGEQWITELSTEDLRSILQLRASAVEAEP
jgi:non-specific serine/threonine protein kinase